MEERPLFKVTEEHYTRAYRNAEGEGRERVQDLILSNLSLFFDRLDYIQKHNEIYLYDPGIFRFGGIPGKAISVYLGPMLEAWDKGLFREQCRHGHDAYIVHCGGSLLSGTVFSKELYCPLCGKKYTIKKQGSVNELFHEAHDLMDGKYNVAEIRKTIKTPLSYSGNSVIEHSLSSETCEKVIKKPVETLGIEGIVGVLRGL